MLGKVYGPYKGRKGVQYVLIAEYNEEGKQLKQESITYERYMEEYNRGLHRYINPVTKTLSSIIKTFSVREVNCSNCTKTMVTNNYNSIKNIYLCSPKCTNVYKKKQTKQRYHGQIVIPIQNKDQLYFIIIEKNEIKKQPLFITANKCTVTVSEDDNSIIRVTLKYDIKDAVRIRPVPGFKKYFWITEDAVLVSRRTKKVLSQTINGTGYWSHTTRIGGRRGQMYCFKIHRLVASAFIPNPDNKPFVNHINGIKLDNYYTNLEWCTPQENAAHAKANGLVKIFYGEQVGTAKLSDNKVIKIRELYKTGNYTHRQLAQMYGVGRSAITDYINRKTYKHV